MLPYPGVYAASAVPLSVLDDPRGRWLIPAVIIGQAWSSAIFLIVPIIILSAYRGRSFPCPAWFQNLRAKAAMPHDDNKKVEMEIRAHQILQDRHR